MPEVFSGGAIRVGSVAKRGAEPLEILPEKANIAAHDAEMGNLTAFNPEIDRLRADAEESGCLEHAQGNIFRVFRLWGR